MVKKTAIGLLLALLIFAIAYFAQRYVDAARNKSTVMKMVKLESKTFDLGSGIMLEMLHAPSGTFRMGNSNSIMSFLPGGEVYNKRETPAHKVELSDFWIGKTEVTQEQYEAIMGKSASLFVGPTLPVERVRWDDAMLFCQKLTVLSGTTFTLPTEAQWEYVCRAGSTGAFCYGDSKGRGQGKYVDSYFGDFAWYWSNSGDKTHPVGEKLPNAWGLYDMHGNVFEWCADWMSDDTYRHSVPKDPTGPGKPLSAIHAMRVVRGGSFNFIPYLARSASRGFAFPSSRDKHTGFRVVAKPGSVK